MMIKIKSGRCRGRFEAKSKAEALVEALMGIGLLSQMPLCTTVFSAGLPCYIAQKNIAIAIAVFFCVVLHQDCCVSCILNCTALYYPPSQMPLLNQYSTASAHTQLVYQLYITFHGTVFFFSAVQKCQSTGWLWAQLSKGCWSQLFNKTDQRLTIKPSTMMMIFMANMIIRAKNKMLFFYISQRGVGQSRIVLNF